MVEHIFLNFTCHIYFRKNDFAMVQTVLKTVLVVLFIHSICHLFCLWDYYWQCLIKWYTYQVAYWCTQFYEDITMMIVLIYRSSPQLLLVILFQSACISRPDVLHSPLFPSEVSFCSQHLGFSDCCLIGCYT